MVASDAAPSIRHAAMSASGGAPNPVDTITGRTLPTRHRQLPGPPPAVTAARSLAPTGSTPPAAATPSAPAAPLQHFPELLEGVSDDDSGDEELQPGLVSASESDSSDGDDVSLGDPALPPAAALPPGVARRSSLAADPNQEADSQDPLRPPTGQASAAVQDLLTSPVSRFPAGLTPAPAQVTSSAAPPPSEPRSSHPPADGSVADATYVQPPEPLRPPAGPARAAAQDPLMRPASRSSAGLTPTTAQVTSGTTLPPSAPRSSHPHADGSVADATYVQPPGPLRPPAGPARAAAQDPLMRPASRFSAGLTPTAAQVTSALPCHRPRPAPLTSMQMEA